MIHGNKPFAVPRTERLMDTNRNITECQLEDSSVESNAFRRSFHIAQDVAS